MHVTATHLRKDLFHCMLLAKQGEEVVITHKGERYRLVPEQPVSKLDRVTAVEGAVDIAWNDPVWEQAKADMQAQWEADLDKWFPR